MKKKKVVEGAWKERQDKRDGANNTVIRPVDEREDEIRSMNRIKMVSQEFLGEMARKREGKGN